jgi:molybdenum cofactor biosynthesis enzyme MoaA
MKIQSLSIAVPAECGNQCKFCVSHMRKDNYINQIEKNTRFYDLYERDYINRLAYARDNGCNSVILTGDGEPLLNRNFLKFFAHCNQLLDKPFRQIELQTSGQLLDDEYLRFLRNTVRVTTISLSVSSLTDWENSDINSPKDEKFKVDISNVCSEIKRYDFILRLSMNMTYAFDGLTPEEIIAEAMSLNANQITFRVLYHDNNDSEESKWVREKACKSECIERIKKFIKENGRPLNRLPHGAVKYSVHGICCVLDEDCMGTEVTEDLKYLILRPNCKLYSHWDDVGSIVF